LSRLKRIPHEHLFTDLRGPLVDGHAQAEPEVVVHVVQPYLVDASAAGLVALVECSTVEVGRNLTILRKPDKKVSATVMTAETFSIAHIV
jgi:hypothetical protein